MAEKKTTSHWIILVLLALAQFMVVLDVSIVNVMLPTVQRTFGLSDTNLQWIITAYSLAFGGFLLLGGRAADLFGRRRVFLCGVTMFSLVSLLDGLSRSGGMLISLRALQGLSGAFMSPAALSIVLVTYREGHERNVALSVWGAVASGGAAVGVLLGGILTQYFGWRWCFFINVPVGILVLLYSLQVLPKHESEERHNDLDLPGAVSITAALMLFVYALTQAPTDGWASHKVLLCFAGTAVLLIAFVVNELHAKHPLMPLSVFRLRGITGANLIQLCNASALFSVFFFTTLYVQDILGYSPIRTGFSFLAVPFAITLTAINAPKIVKKVGFKPVLIVAPLITGVGLFMLAHIPAQGSYWTHVFPGLVIMGLGLGATFVSVLIAATSGLPPHLSGLASGLINTSQQIGGSLGLAVLTGISASSATRYLKHARPVTHYTTVAATVHGFQSGYYVAALFTVLAAVFALTILKWTTKQSTPADSEPAVMG